MYRIVSMNSYFSSSFPLDSSNVSTQPYLLVKVHTRVQSFEYNSYAVQVCSLIVGTMHWLRNCEALTMYYSSYKAYKRSNGKTKGKCKPYLCG